MKYLTKNQKGIKRALIIVAVLVVIIFLAFIFANPSNAPSNGQPKVEVNESNVNQELEKELGISPSSEKVGNKDETTDGVKTDETDEIIRQAPTDTKALADNKQFTITYTDSGFAPETVTIKKGDTVKFVNNSSRAFWPATNVHPTHTAYPGSNIKKCQTAQAGDIFDACRPVNPGESYSFTFDQIGEWRYHDHLRANQGGKVIVSQ